MSQEKLAHKAKITSQYLSNVERNKHDVTVGVLVRLCRALDIAPAELIGRADRNGLLRP